MGFLRLKLLLRFAIRPAHERLLATGEIRGYDVFQTDYVDIGVIVTESERGKGLATQVLRQLCRHERDQWIEVHLFYRKRPYWCAKSYQPNWLLCEQSHFPIPRISTLELAL
jgi:hypothetical protein